METDCRRRRPRRLWSLLIVAVLLAVTACGAANEGATSTGANGKPTLTISSIPDQDPDTLAARDGAMAKYLSGALGVEVKYVPVTDYAASISLFRTGDLDMVFFGGLTGVQARLQDPGSTLIAQRDIDAAFQSVFIANTSTGIAPVQSVQGLAAFKGKRFTFGSESSTSGRLMPEYFLDQAGVTSATDFAGPPGYSGSHDKTIDLVESGSYQGGALNIEVWNSRLAANAVDTSKVTAVFTTPPFHDYHWLAGPETDSKFGAGFTDKIKSAMLALNTSDPAQAQVLKLYGAKSFIATEAANYEQIESIGRKLNLIT
jgi:phosphonate transport system substrate-binding protein